MALSPPPSDRGPPPQVVQALAGDRAPGHSGGAACPGGASGHSGGATCPGGATCLTLLVRHTLSSTAARNAANSISRVRSVINVVENKRGRIRQVALGEYGQSPY